MKNNSVKINANLRKNIYRLYDTLNISNVKEIKDEEKIKYKFYKIILKIYLLVVYNEETKYTKDEINFIIEYNIYKSLKEIIKMLQDFDN